MKWVGIVVVVVVVATGAGAGEILFANGSRLTGELANEVIMVSTGSALIEVLPEQVGQLTPEAVYLTDGRVVRGTVVGGRVRTRTPLGELSIGTDELRHYRAEGFVATAGTAPVPQPEGPQVPSPAAQPAPAALSRRAAAPDTAPRPPAEDVTSTPRPEAAPTAAASTSRGRLNATRAPRLLEVTASRSPLYRDAVRTASPVGWVRRGDQVAFVDFIDRRLRILDWLVFDGGHWIRVRASNGTVGWLPATVIREVQ